MSGGVKVFLREDIPHRKVAMRIHRPLELTPKWLTQKAASGGLGHACRIGFCVSSDMTIQAFERMVANWDSSPFAQMFIAITEIDKAHAWAMLVSQVCGKEEAEPAAFQEFKTMPSIHKTTRFAKLSDLTKELASSNISCDRQSTFVVKLWACEVMADMC